MTCRWRRGLVAVATALAVAGAAAAGVLALGAATNAGRIPWLAARPQLGPADPVLAPACTASQLQATLALQGATGNLVGAIQIRNRSSRACALVGRPKLSFVGATSKWRVTRWHGSPDLPYDPLAPPPGSLRALAPAKVVSVALFWSNWCGSGSSDTGNSGRPPSALVLAVPGGGTIRLAQNRIGGGKRPLGAPPCLAAHSPSKLMASRFTPIAPQGPPSSELPLRARIVSAARLTIKGKVVTPVLVARPGSVLAYTVVLTNRGRHAFRFGSSCPAYTEGIDANRQQAYILNCHPVGPIAPGKSVRFAMRIRVPRTLRPGKPAVLGWILAPHTWNAPQAVPASLDVRR
jgi:Domain of unknown function (DUF4232)